MDAEVNLELKEQQLSSSSTHKEMVEDQIAYIFSHVDAP